MFLILVIWKILFLQNVFNFKSKSKDEERFYEKSNAIFEILFNMNYMNYMN